MNGLNFLDILLGGIGILIILSFVLNLAFGRLAGLNPVMTTKEFYGDTYLVKEQKLLKEFHDQYVYIDLIALEGGIRNEGRYFSKSDFKLILKRAGTLNLFVRKIECKTDEDIKIAVYEEEAYPRDGFNQIWAKSTYQSFAGFGRGKNSLFSIEIEVPIFVYENMQTDWDHVFSDFTSKNSDRAIPAAKEINQHASIREIDQLKECLLTNDWWASEVAALKILNLTRLKYLPLLLEALDHCNNLGHDCDGLVSGLGSTLIVNNEWAKLILDNLDREQCEITQETIDWAYKYCEYAL